MFEDIGIIPKCFNGTRQRNNISPTLKLKSKMRTDPKSGYTRWMRNYCPVKL